MKIRFAGSVEDSSGYGEFSRYFVKALHDAGHEVCVEPILVDPKPNVDFGSKGALCRKLRKKIRRPDINIVNMIPMFFKRYSIPGVPNVGFTMWETTKLPESWVKACNDMDAIFVPCEWNKKVFAESGVKVPLYVITPGIDESEVPEQVKIKDKKEDKFYFYSIFQFIERKNPVGLIRAYFSEFSGNNDVALVLKTYRHARIPNNQQLLLKEIDNIKKDLKLTHYPEIHLLTDFLSHDQMELLHKGNHCFVLPHRSEGVGLPHMNAMLYGNPTIATNFSGNVDFMNNENSYLIPYQLTPTFGMSWFVPWYDGTMYWAEPDLHALAKAMRHVYNNREEAFEKGSVGRKYIIDNFNSRKSADSLMSAVDSILEVVK